MRGNASFLTERVRQKYRIRQDDAGEFYSELLQEAGSTSPAPSPELEDIPEDEGDEQRELLQELRDMEEEVRPKTEWQRFLKAIFENDPDADVRYTSAVSRGEITMQEADQYLSLLRRWKRAIDRVYR